MIKPEVALLSILINLDVYNKYRQYIVLKEEKELSVLYSLLDKLIDTYKRDLTFDEYCLYVSSQVTNNLEIYSAILDEARKANVQLDMATGLLETLKERNLAHAIALAAIDVTEGRKSFLELSSLLDTHAEITEEEENVFVSDDLAELYESHVNNPGLRWRLQSLNHMLGSLRVGDFGFLFARPETGKTTFLASEMTYFASQLKEDSGPILWFNNEEEGKKVQLRIFQAALGVTLEQLFSNKEKSNTAYHEITKGKIKIIDGATISKFDVEKYCKTYKPSAIIFDQIDKIKGFLGDREDLKLGYIYQWGRELAKTYCPVIAVTQADGTAEGKKWLTMEHVANAKTSKQAEADWILGIGATHQEGFEYIRHLHASKNKLTGDVDSKPALRHGKIDVIIEPEIARFSDYK
jgi:replicative DNA helicase